MSKYSLHSTPYKVQGAYFSWGWGCAGTLECYKNIKNCKIFQLKQVIYKKLINVCYWRRTFNLPYGKQRWGLSKLRDGTVYNLINK